MANAPQLTLITGEDRHVAAGGVQRGVIGLGLGVALGALLRVISRPSSPHVGG